MNTASIGGGILGLAPLARMAFAGGDLSPVRARLLDRISSDPDDAGALMDLSIVMQLSGQRQCGLSIQKMALEVRQIYHIRDSDSPKIRLLALVAPGDLAQNNAVEFLTEGSDTALDLLYVSPDLPFPGTVPEHDVAMVCVCEGERNRRLLDHAGALVSAWPRPVICPPDRIARLSRDGAGRLLQGLPGPVMPLTRRVDRAALAGVNGCEFPIIARPVDSQKGYGLVKLDSPAAVAAYLEGRPEAAFYAAPFIDYRSPDGQFRKFRIVLIAGRPYACHMAISGHWIVHYLSAGMERSSAKRAEEARFFASFDTDFAVRHGPALEATARRLELEYVGIDCGETPDGRLLVFEADSGMTVHSMDAPDLFPYKQPQMQKVFEAFRRMIFEARTRQRPLPPAGPSLLFCPQWTQQQPSSSTPSIGNT